MVVGQHNVFCLAFVYHPASQPVAAAAAGQPTTAAFGTFSGLVGIGLVVLWQCCRCVLLGSLHLFKFKRDSIISSSYHAVTVGCLHLSFFLLGSVRLFRP